MEISSRIGRPGSGDWRLVRWLRRHKSEFMAVAALAFMLAPLLL